MPDSSHPAQSSATATNAADANAAANAQPDAQSHPHAHSQPDSHAVRTFLLGWQKELCANLEALETELFGTVEGPFNFDKWQRQAAQPAAPVAPALSGEGISAVAAGGRLWERAGVNFSHVKGASLPASASANRPQLAGRAFEAMGVSIVIHPLNPYLPTTHANIRFLCAHDPQNPQAPAIWWFGGGFDLTPYYGFEEDAVHWHRCAREACAPFGAETYPAFKSWCDRYFHLPHRGEQRGIGGLFFDDVTRGGDFTESFALARSVAEHLIKGYAPIVRRRAAMPYTERERNWQLYRRGRYVEFNLVYDRGTLFGLQSRGRTESILMSMPPLVRWEYDYHPEPGSPEAELLSRYLLPQEWV